MTSVYVFGIILGVLFVTGLLAAPLLEDEPAGMDGEGEGGSPEERREAALDALEELQFEHETGKLSDEDYRRLRARYARAAVEARHAQEDAAEDGPGGGQGEPASGAEAGASGRGAEDGPGFCPECGAEAGAGDRFCARCGSELP